MDDDYNEEMFQADSSNEEMDVYSSEDENTAEETEEDEDEIDEDTLESINVSSVIKETPSKFSVTPHNKRITTPYLTKYEKAKVLSIRVEQLENGSSPMVEIENLNHVIDIARKELDSKVLPFIVSRPIVVNREKKMENIPLGELIE